MPLEEFVDGMPDCCPVCGNDDLDDCNIPEHKMCSKCMTVIIEMDWYCTVCRKSHPNGGSAKECCSENNCGPNVGVA